MVARERPVSAGYCLARVEELSNTAGGLKAGRTKVLNEESMWGKIQGGVG